MPFTCPLCEVMASRVGGSGPVQNGSLSLSDALTSGKSDESGEIQHELLKGKLSP